MKLHFRVFRTMMLSALLLVGMVAEARVVSGTVTDPTGETIISASVVVKGTTIGTVTDFDGNYTLDVPDDATVLVFSYIGMQTQELTITGDVMNVVLRENSEVLDEVVVTGYGTTKKRDLVTSVASVNADQLKDVPVASASEALQGKLAGVTVTTTEGSPDADVKIRVRAGTSLTQSSDPLYIVDGFPVSSISDIAPGDIQSMDVLKDAAATAIYGAQGANGVIIITTKDVASDLEDKMQIHVDYTGYAGWKKMAKKYDMMGVRDYILMQNEAYNIIKGADGEKTFHKFFDEKYFNNPSPENMQSMGALLDYWDDGQHYTDWQEETFGRTGVNSNHSISVSGGNKNANFNLNYSRIDDKSIMQGSDYARNNISFKGKFKPINGLTIGVTTRFSNTNVLGSGTNTAEDKGSTSESRVRNAVAYSPIRLFKETTSEDDPDAESFGSLRDPITTIVDNYQHKVDNKWFIDGYVQYKFLKDFTIKVDVGYESRDVAKDRFYGPSTYYSGPNGDAKSHTNNVPYYGNTVSTDYKTSRFRNVNTFEYAHKWDNAHNFSVLVGEEMNIFKGETRTMEAYGFNRDMPGPDVFKHLGMAQDAVVRNVIDPTDNMLSFFARANYDFKGRYYITATFRADGSSRFTEGHQWGFFPSVAAAWRIVDEPFMEPAQDVLSNLKLRLSYGSVGNNNVDLGYLRSEYLASQTTYTGVGTNILTDGGDPKNPTAANSNLKWETTITRDLGIDFGFWNERLSGTLDLYWNNTKDLILKYRLNTGGYTYQYRNIGSTENMGIEFTVNGVVLDERSKDLHYNLTLSANISHNRNRVVDLGGMSDYRASTNCFSTGYTNNDYEYMLTVGSAIGDVYGYKSDGWYTADDFDRYNATSDTWEKRNEDGTYSTISTLYGLARPGMTKLASEERQKLGNTMPIINGGFGFNFRIGGEKWGDIDVSTQFTYSYGNKVLNLSRLDYSTIVEKTLLRNCDNALGYGRRYSTFIMNGDDFKSVTAYATTERVGRMDYVQGDNYTQMAALLAELNANATAANPVATKEFCLTDQYLEDASFLRLSTLTIGYTLPEKYMKKAYIQKCRIFFTASNVFCATKYSGSDPEVDARSKNNPLTPNVDFSAFPKNRAFNFGLNLSF